MEFIKTILEKAVITDGKLDVEGTMKLINAETVSYTHLSSGI